jgi:thiol-disulfide isomerase/thioredoxin
VPSGGALVFYSSLDCPLCDKSWPVAEQLARRFGLALEKIDIRSEASLVERYGERIPVLLLDGEELGWGRLSSRALDRKLRERQSGG